MIVENQNIRKRRLNDLKQILLTKQYPAEIINFDNALTQTPDELRRVREKPNENNFRLSGNNVQSQQSASISAGQENTPYAEPKLLIKINYEQDYSNSHSTTTQKPQTDANKLLFH